MKGIKFIIASAMFMLSCSMVFADDYTVGLKKMFESNALESVDMSAINELTQGKSITTEQVVDMFVEHIAPYYRENMSLEEFNAMVEFCTAPEYVEVKNRVATLGTQNLEKDMEIIFSESKINAIVTDILSGKKYKTTAKAACSPEYDAEIATFLELANFDGVMNGILPGIKESMMKEAEGSPEAAQMKPVIEKMADELCNILTEEGKISVCNSLTRNVSIEDLKRHNSITEQPFYPNMNKASAALASNIINISLKVAQEIMEK